MERVTVDLLVRSCLDFIMRLPFSLAIVVYGVCYNHLGWIVGICELTRRWSVSTEWVGVGHDIFGGGGRGGIVGREVIVSIRRSVSGRDCY